MEDIMLGRLLAGLGLAALVSSTIPAAAQPYSRPALATRPVLSGPGLAERLDHRSPLNPLDAPDAGTVWKPSNRDAGNLAEERWAAYAERRAALPAGQVAQAPPRKTEPWNRYPHYDSIGEFLDRIFR